MYGAGRVNAAVDRAVKANSVSRSRGTVAGVIGEVAGAVLSPLARAAGTKLGQALRPVGRAIDDRLPGINSKDEAARRQRSTTTTTPKPQGTAKPASVADYKDAQGNTYDGNTGRLKQAKKPANPTPAPARSGSSGSGGNSGGSAPTAPRSSSAPARRSAAPASNAGMKNQDKNFRGNLFEKTFGYKRGEAPDQVKGLAQKAGNSDNFNTKSDLFIPQTKVDGSEYSKAKIDMKKVKEYDRIKRRYND